MELDFNNPPSPYGHPLQMVDRVQSFDASAAVLVAMKAVSRNEPLLQGHFPGFPILPGILQIEMIAQASALLLDALQNNVMPSRMVVVESKLKHSRPVLPGDLLLAETRLIQSSAIAYTFKARLTVAGEEAAKGQIVLENLDARRLRLAEKHD